MSEDTHIAVIGAGLIGLSCADEFLRRAARVTVIDKQAAPMRGTSFSNSGMIHPSQAQSWTNGLDAAKDVYKLARQSAGLLTANMGRLGLDAMAQRPKGSLKLYETGADMDRAKTHYDVLGVKYEARQEADSFGKPALFFPEDRSGDARTYGEALSINLAERGGQFHLGQPVTNLTKAGAGWNIKLSDQTVCADHVIVAAGIATPDLLAPLGLDVPITPVIGHALNFSQPDMSLPKVPIMDAASHSALSVFESVARISGGLQIDKPEDLLTRWRIVAPKLIAALGPVQSTWSAPRPVTPQGRPFIAKAGEGLWINAGHAHMGWTLSAGSGALMAEMIFGAKAAPEFRLP